MGWLKRLFGKGADDSTANAEDSAAAPSEATRSRPKGYYDGDPPVPEIVAVQHSRTYEGRDEGEPIEVVGYNLRTADGRILYAERCGITRWQHLGIYLPDFVGESHVPQEALRTIQVGAAARLVPEPTNEYDANAIRIETVDGVRVGYIAARATGSLRRAFRQLDDHEELHCSFFERHTLRRSGDVVSAKVVLWRTGALDGLAPAPHDPFEA